MIRRIKNKYQNQTLHQKVRSSILLFSLLPLVIIACILFAYVWRYQMEEIRSQTKKDLADEYTDMVYEMNTIELLAKTVWSDTTFISEVGKAATDGSLKEYDRYIFQEHTLASIRVITSVSQVQCARLHLDYPGMREYAYYLYSMDRACNSLWYEDRDTLPRNGAWYMDSMDEPPYGTYFEYYTEKNMASFVLPIRVNNKMMGVFEIGLPMQGIVPRLYDSLDHADMILVDSLGKLHGVNENSGFAEITVQDLEAMLEIDAVSDYREAGVQLYRTKWGKTPVILAAVRDGRTGSLLISLTSVREQYRTAFFTILGILAAEVLLVLILIQVIEGIVNRLLSDFDTFAGYMQKTEEGNLYAEIPGLEQKEINALAMEYNRMLRKIRQLMEDSIQREVMVKDAQLKSLEKQIDSHFLYNVLDSIKMMAEVRGIYNVSDALLALGRMFRYNLQIDEHTVTLGEEIAYLENYLKLCNIRYDYYITLSENIEEPLRTLKVPKVILQPLAENSIIYGLDEQAQDTAIYLKAYQKDGCVFIEMSDMGKGMSEPLLEDVRQGILFGKGEDSGGIGLHNIHERIRLMYGDEYGVSIFSKENCYTKVVLKLRAEEEL